jgi:D-glycero-alpha-D-manno-heptose-7-phosphate kinase
LYTHRKRHIHQEELAALACHIEIDRLGEPIGKQDQYIAAFGGITCFEFRRDDTVATSPLKINMETMFDLEDNLLLFFTGFSRSAGGILKEQHVRSQSQDSEMINNLHYVKELGLRSKAALEQGDSRLFGELMHEHWEHKKKRSGGMSNRDIDNWYELGMRNGAVGGKLVGAGGGGFLMFYASDRNQLRRAMAGAGLEEVRFRFDFEGTKVVMSS